jgi:hypothetical protein
MKFSTVLTLGLAAFVMAVPAPEPVAEAGLADQIAGNLPHPLTASDIMTTDKPVDLVSRQANTTANAAGKGMSLWTTEQSSI